MKNGFLFFVVLFSLQANAQFNKSKMDSLFYQLDKNNKAMLSTTIYKKGKEVYAKSIGYSNIESNEKATASTTYHIGSITKMFTAIMILQLIEEKKLHINTKLNLYYPFIKNSKEITIGNMLNHSSGIHNFTNDSLYYTYMEKPLPENQMVTIFNNLPSDFEPGTKNEYSNSNYVLLSYIVEKVGRKPYNKQLQERICSKLNLQQTAIDGMLMDKSAATQSYDFKDNNWKPSTKTHATVCKGAGAIVSTPSDLCVFIDGLFNGKLINDTSLSIMKKMTNNYGSGLFIFPFFDKQSYGHTGGIDGYQSMLSYFEKEKTAFCILGNAYNYPINDIAIGELSIYNNKPYAIPTFTKTATAKLSTSLLGEYANSKMGMKITITEKDKQLFAQATNQSAFPLEKINELEYKFEPANIKMIFIKNKEGNISSFTLQQGGMDLLFEK